jgi:ribosome-binding factor A
MNERRLKKISVEIRKIISELIMSGEIRDGRISTLTSITDVETTDDLRYCYVYVSDMEDDIEKAKKTIKGLKSAKGFIRTELSKKLKLQFTPEPVFRLDDSIKTGMKIEGIIKGLHQDDEEN